MRPLPDTLAGARVTVLELPEGALASAVHEARVS